MCREIILKKSNFEVFPKICNQISQQILQKFHIISVSILPFWYIWVCRRKFFGLFSVPRVKKFDDHWSIRLFRQQIVRGRRTTEGIDTVFENVYNFLRLCHLLLQSSSSPPRRIGSETSKKCIGSEMSEKTIWNYLIKFWRWNFSGH